MVTGGTELEGVANGKTFSFFLFLLLSGVIAGLNAGLAEAVALGDGFSFRLFLFLPGEIDGLTAGALGLTAAAGLVPGAGAALAVEIGRAHV